jgi:hypothetical protein
MKAATIVALLCLVAGGYITGLAQETKPKATATKTPPTSIFYDRRSPL